uniref:RRM domain-containing protein n=1 Tax=Steinernema glaseri TaxID=37863 RepID=A0A1I7ZEU9_9BILA
MASIYERVNTCIFSADGTSRVLVLLSQIDPFSRNPQDTTCYGPFATTSTGNVFSRPFSSIYAFPMPYGAISITTPTLLNSFWRNYAHGPCAQGYNFIPIAFGVLLYVVYLMECWHYRSKLDKIKKVSRHARGEQLHPEDEDGDADRVVEVRLLSLPTQNPPDHKVRCGFAESSCQFRYRNGDAITATQVYYERVNSHTSGNVFLFDICGYKDISKSLADIEKYPVVRIRFSKGFVFACVEAANEFEEQRMRFFNENEVRDDYMEVREGLDFADCEFDEQVMAFSGTSRKYPWYFNPVVFWIVSCLLLSWPLRMFSEWSTAHLHYQVTKLFGTNYLSVNYTGPLTRTSTMESGELEIAVRQNYLIVPSYSEAILLDTIPNHHTNQQILTHPRLTIRNMNHPILHCNEPVIQNYGAISENAPRPQNLYFNRCNYSSIPGTNVNHTPGRSRSMTFFQGSARSAAHIQQCSTSAVPLPRVAQLKRPQRSISIGGIANGNWRQSNGRQDGIPNDDRRPLLEPFGEISAEAPPPYEVALRMCAPFYERIRQSANSISSVLHSLSRSNSKDFRQFGFDGPCGSKD